VKRPLEDAWEELTRNMAFSRDSDRQLLRGFYFAGASAAIGAATTWDPDSSDVYSVKCSMLDSVVDELTMELAGIERNGAAHA